MSKLDEEFLQSKYDFLRENTDLKNIIYLVISGSYGYGTNINNSDIDLRGVLLEDRKYLYGLKEFEQFEESTTDTVIYGLNKFVRLCINANPNTIELLGVEEDCIVKMTEAGRKLREHTDLFLTKKVIGSFGNYAAAQLRRLQNALCHDSYEEKQQMMHLRNSLNAQLEHFNRTYTRFDDGAINIYVDPKSNELKLDIELRNYPMKEFMGIYSELNNTIKTYNKLNHRNNKKDEPHLYKHAMHLIRLLITGTDILNGKGIITKRVAEHDLLMSIRNGEYQFEEIFRIMDGFQAEFEKAAANTKLPEKVDRDKIEQFLVEFY